ncbi:unnamed protein product [Cylindrotheca closterium]|uniref:Uncharacterized protein n=1 Tax=Cylindrotheca closterium TaxID=2856 RepID=A0AAD2CUF7_9STRA|nr:unnamed protein product [Cylindrotheca closterium]
MLNRTKSALIYSSPWSLDIYDSIKIVSLTRSGPNLNCLSPYTNFLNRSSITHERARFLNTISSIQVCMTSSLGPDTRRPSGGASSFSTGRKGSCL